MVDVVVTRGTLDVGEIPAAISLAMSASDSVLMVSPTLYTVGTGGTRMPGVPPPTPSKIVPRKTTADVMCLPLQFRRRRPAPDERRRPAAMSDARQHGRGDDI